MLVKALREASYNAREVNQEHSYVPTMWRRFTEPDVLIYLDVSQAVASQRRSSEAGAAWWSAMKERLQHARQHADLLIETDGLRPRDVVKEAISFLERRAGW